MIHEQTLNGKVFHEIKHEMQTEFIIYNSWDDMRNSNPSLRTSNRNAFIGIKLNEIRKQVDQQTFK